MNRSAVPLAEEQTRMGYLYLITLIAAVGGFLFGYDISLISGAIEILVREWELSAFWKGAVTGSAILGCPFGALMGVWLADKLGRNRALIFSAILFIVSALGSSLAAGKLDFFLWRFIGGMGVGLASTISPMYIAELSPPRLRGRMVVINQLAIVIGLSLSVFVDYPLSFGDHWRWMFATMAVPATALLVGLFFVPRSPRWLAAQGQYDAAREVLCAINGPEQAERELAEIRNELGEETGGFDELLRPGVRLALVLGILLMVFSQINGVNMILIYTPTLFVEAGVTNNPNAILNSVYIYAWITLCTVIAFWLTARFGRRPILICGTLGMATGHVLMFLQYAFHVPTALTLLAMAVPTGAFTLTLAPLSWVILSEFFPNRVRGKAMSLATLAMFTASYITTNVFPMVLDAFKEAYGHPGGTFLIFCGICLTCSAFVWRFIPETKDRSLEDIGQYWLDFDRGGRGR